MEQSATTHVEERRRSLTRRALNDKAKQVVRSTYCWYHRAAPIAIASMAIYLLLHNARV